MAANNPGVSNRRRIGAPLTWMLIGMAVSSVLGALLIALGWMPFSPLRILPLLESGALLALIWGYVRREGPFDWSPDDLRPWSLFFKVPLSVLFAVPAFAKAQTSLRSEVSLQFLLLICFFWMAKWIVTSMPRRSSSTSVTTPRPPYWWEAALYCVTAAVLAVAAFTSWDVIFKAYSLFFAVGAFKNAYYYFRGVPYPVRQGWGVNAKGSDLLDDGRRSESRA